MGRLASLDHEITFQDLRLALVYGTVTASFTIEDFGVRRLDGLTFDEIDKRLREYGEMLDL